MNNVASVATTLIELYREGLPAMLGAQSWQSRTQSAKDAFASTGGEYLNVQFGWKPLVSDITAAMKVMADFDKLYKQAIRDSGRVVRRRYSFPPIRTISETEVVSGLFTPTLVAASSRSSLFTNAPAGGRVSRIRETTKKQWFSGAFTYHIPDIYYGSNAWNGSKRAIDLLGLDLNPEVIWNVSPWSWAVDWFASVGDIIHNLNTWSKYGLVLKYGYIMEHSIVSDMYVYSGPTGFKTAEALPAVVELVTETKLRRRATPFGFGFNMGGLDNTQKAILAALGISRL